MPRPGRREHLIKTAIDLFCRDGFHATGIDKIMTEAGVSKKTIYTHFRSKEELILAALRDYDGIFRNQFMMAVGKAGPDPAQQLLAVFDVAGQWFMTKDFFGCLFIKAIGEYADPDSPIREVSQHFKRMMRSFISELVRDTACDDPEKLTQELALVLEGAIVTAQMAGTAEAAQTARQIADILMKTRIKGYGGDVIC